MKGELADRITAEVRRTARLYERLVVIVGPSGAGKTAALRAVGRRGGVPLQGPLRLLRGPLAGQDGRRRVERYFVRELAGWQKHERMIELSSSLLEQNFSRDDGVGEVPGQIHGYLSTRMYFTRIRSF